jgi:glycosyltransferase involved in cell wall biosynthesis
VGDPAGYLCLSGAVAILAAVRVLLSAYVCRPGRGSEPGTGWGFLRAIARDHEVTLITLPDYLGEIESALAAEGLDGVTIVPVASPRWLRPFEGRVGLGHVDYLIWQYRARNAARPLLAKVDVIHHVTFANDWLPSAVHFLDGVPVVWGPVGGTAPMPWRLGRFLSLRGLVFELVRQLITRSARLLTAALVRRRVDLVVAMNRDVAERFEGLGPPVVVEPHVALENFRDVGIGAPPNARTDGRHRAMFAGNLLSLKGPYLAVAALARLGDDWTLDVYGDGPEADGLREQAERLGVASRVQMLGRRPRDEVLSALTQADVLMFPSMHDSGGWAVAEAVRAGCPVVCLDIGGPPLIIDGTSGEAVRPDAQAPQRLARAVPRVRRHPPSDRWSADRLGPLVTEWYEMVLADRRPPAGARRRSAEADVPA